MRAFSLVIQVSSEESKEVVHLSLEELCEILEISSWYIFCSRAHLLLSRVLNCLGEVGESIAHLSGGDVRGRVLKSLISIS